MELSATQEVTFLLALTAPILVPILCSLVLAVVIGKKRLEKDRRRLQKLYTFYRISGRRK